MEPVCSYCILGNQCVVPFYSNWHLDRFGSYHLDEVCDESIWTEYKSLCHQLWSGFLQSGHSLGCKWSLSIWYVLVQNCFMLVCLASVYCTWPHVCFPLSFSLYYCLSGWLAGWLSSFIRLSLCKVYANLIFETDNTGSFKVQFFCFCFGGLGVMVVIISIISKKLILDLFTYLFQCPILHLSIWIECIFC